MTTTKISKEEFEALRQYINEQCGILLGDNKDYLVESRLSDLVIQSGCSTFSDFYLKARSQPASGLKDKIVDAMTTNETLWFRDSHPFSILQQVILPQYLEEVKAKNRHKINIWSAACSTGQEAYSIAMVVQEFCRTTSLINAKAINIKATDISPSALYLAMNAKYDNIAMGRGMPSDLKDRYFIENGKLTEVRPEVKNMVQFQQLNLQNSFAGLGTMDIIFCRYVAIYFSDEFKKSLYQKFAEMLNPGGYLFLGGSESLTGYSDSFELRSHSNGRYYQLKG